MPRSLVEDSLTPLPSQPATRSASPARGAPGRAEAAEGQAEAEALEGDWADFEYSRGEGVLLPADALQQLERDLQAKVTALSYA